MFFEKKGWPNIYDQRYDYEKHSKYGKPYDANFYLDELVKYMPELKTMKKPLTESINLSKKRIYNQAMAESLTKTFQLINKTAEVQKRIPDPQKHLEDKRHLQAWDGTITRLIEIPLDQTPYAIAVVDIKNLLNLPNVADIFEIEYEEAVLGLLNYVKKAVSKITTKYSGVNSGGLCNDNVILYGREPDEVYNCITNLMAETTKEIMGADFRLKEFGLLRAGIAWKDNAMGTEFKSIRPGIIALKIGDKPGLKPGTISITKAIYNRLSVKNQNEFVASGIDTETRQIIPKHFQFLEI